MHSLPVNKSAKSEKNKGFFHRVMQKNDSILITGASGMVGSALRRLLAERGFSRVLAPAHAELELRDQAAVNAYMAAQKPDYVFHLAARVGGIHANSTYPGQFIYDNTAMHLNVMDAARKAGVRKLLFPGSACTYPKLAPQPVAEAEFLNGYIEPTNIAYAAAKINGITMAQSYAREYGMQVVVPMPTNTYGINDNFDPAASHVIPALMKRFHAAKLALSPEEVIWGSGTPLREFIYVDDLADALLFLMERYDDPGIINVGSMQEITIGELAKLVAKTVGYRGNISLDTEKPDGAPRKMLDSGKLFSLGWKPVISLEEGLGRMYAYHFTEEARKTA